MNNIKCDKCGTTYQVQDGEPMRCSECGADGGTIIIKKIKVEDIDTTEKKGKNGKNKKA